MQFLRANTAVDVLIGPFVDVTDGSTAETGLTLDVELSKLGQALANKNDATTPVHDTGGNITGHYNCELDVTDTNAEGTLVLLAFDSAALIVRHEYMVLAEAAWDSMFVAKDTGFMDVNVKAVSEDESAADNLESACDNYTVTRGLTGTALPAAAADAAGGVPLSTAGSLEMDTLADWINGGRLDLLLDAIPTTAMRGTDNAATAANLATVDGIVDAILVDTDTTIPGLINGLDDVTAAQVLTQVNTALDTAISELGVAAPTATPTVRTALMLMYMALRNRTDTFTSGTDALRIYNNAGTIIATKALTDSAGDYSEAEMISG